MLCPCIELSTGRRNLIKAKYAYGEQMSAVRTWLRLRSCPMTRRMTR